MSEKFFDSNNLDVLGKAAAKQSPGGDVNNLVWNTPEGLAVKALRPKKDVENPGSPPIPAWRLRLFLRGPQPTMYAVKPARDHPPVRVSPRPSLQRFYRKARRRRPGRLRRLRPGDPPRLTPTIPRQLATSARPAWRSTGRGHEDPLRRHSARQDFRLDDHERRRAHPRRLHRRRRGAGRDAGTAVPGTIQNDILKEFMVRNTYIYPPDAVDEDHRRHLRLHRAEHAEVQLDLDPGYHIQEAGANQAIELAFTLADGMEYVRTGVASGHGRRCVLPAACPSSGQSA